MKVGQLWGYKTRRDEEESKVLILKKEGLKEETIISVSVINVNVKNHQIKRGISKEIGHLPFSEKAIIDSVTKLESSNNKLPKFEEGYNVWKEAYETEKAGVFSISVKEAINYVEKTMNQ